MQIFFSQLLMEVRLCPRLQCAFEARILPCAFIYWRTQSCLAHSFQKALMRVAKATKPDGFFTAPFGDTGPACTEPVVDRQRNS